MGYITNKSDIPNFANIAYLYTNLDLVYVGNYEELQSDFQNHLIEQNVSSVKQYLISQSTMYAKSFYENSENFESVNYFWNLDSVWYIQDMKALPVLQLYQTFEYELSQKNSFYEIAEPDIGSGVVVFVGKNDIVTEDNYVGITSGTFTYDSTISICAYVTNKYNISKFFDIVGLRKDNEVIYSSKELQLYHLSLHLC
mgnify:CR=1 FL=1